MTYTEKELDQFLHGISLSLLSKKSAQHWRYDEETAKEIEWLEALERKVRADKADRKTENSSEKPNNCEECEYWSDTEDGCADRHGCKTTEDSSTVPTSSKMELVDKDTNVRSKDEPQTITAEEKAELLDAIGGGEFFPKDEPTTEDWQDWKDRMWAEAVVTEPKTQTETKNSNLGFEKPQTERSE